MRLFYSFFFTLLIFPFVQTNAQQVWAPIQLSQIPAGEFKEMKFVPSRYQLYQVNASTIQQDLRQIVLNKEIGSIALPTPEGAMINFTATYSSVMQSGLERNHPEIRTFYIQGTKDKDIIGRIGYNTSGLFGVLSDHGREYILQQTHDKSPYYFVYYSSDDLDGQHLLHSSICPQDEAGQAISVPQNIDIRSDEKRMRHFRVAIACTSTFASDVGGTQQKVLEKIISVMNGVNLRYNRDMGMHFDLIDKDTILFNLDPDTDYFKNTTNGGGLLSQNQSFLNNKLTAAEYDFSQVWTTRCTDVGGVVSGRACENGTKARGVSCGPNNVSYFLTTVKHEMGHQFSASHTFNRCGESTQFASEGAYEPGSGSTIMAYPGACGSDNVQGYADDYFHVISIIQMTNFITAKTTCGTDADEINHTPDAEILLPTNHLTIPANTPYELIGHGRDVDGDNLVYNWEEFDIGNNEPLGTNEITGPMNRSFRPQALDTLRLIPSFSNLINDISDITDRFPTVSREMNWKFNTRDQNLKAGSTIHLDYAFDVTDQAGPFRIEFPGPGEDTTLQLGQYVEIVWDVANTNVPPVNAKTVDIMISKNSRNDFPDTLALATPNDGREYVMMPYTAAKARFKVKAHDNIFLDISRPQNPIVEPDSAGYSFDLYPHDILVCPGNNGQFQVKTLNWKGYSTPVHLVAVDGLPAGGSVIFGKEDINPGENTTMTLDISGVNESGFYTIRVAGITPDRDTIWRSITAEVLASSLAEEGVSNPDNGEKAVKPTPEFSWNPISGADNYYFELASDPYFSDSSILAQSYGPGTTYTWNKLLKPGTIYYWRIKASNRCHTGEWSRIFTFQTELFECYDLSGIGLPIAISSNPSAPPVGVKFNLSDVSGITNDVNVKNVNITHGNIGNLEIYAKAPSGKEIILFSDQCKGFSNMRVTFDDEALSDIVCGGMNENNTYKPINPLSDFDGEEINGEWSVLVKTLRGGASGSIKSIDFELCASVNTKEIATINNDLLKVKKNNPQVIPQQNLRYTIDSVDDDHIVITLLSVPQHGSLTRYGHTLNVGDTLLQSWINDYQLVYEPNTDYVGTDSFFFMVRDQKFSYLAPQLFNIDVQEEYSVANKKASQLETLIVSPNPTTGSLEINLSGIDMSKGAVLNIWDGNGNKLWSKSLPALTQNARADISQYSPGVYYVQLIHPTSVLIKRVIKMN